MSYGAQMEGEYFSQPSFNLTRALSRDLGPGGKRSTYGDRWRTRRVEFAFDKIHAFDVADDNIAQLVDRGNQACGPDCCHRMDHARHLFFEPAVARSAVGTGGG